MNDFPALSPKAEWPSLSGKSERTRRRRHFLRRHFTALLHLVVHYCTFSGDTSHTALLAAPETDNAPALRPKTWENCPFLKFFPPRPFLWAHGRTYVDQILRISTSAIVPHCTRPFRLKGFLLPGAGLSFPILPFFIPEDLLTRIISFPLFTISLSKFAICYHGSEMEMMLIILRSPIPKFAVAPPLRERAVVLGSTEQVHRLLGSPSIECQMRWG